MLGSSRESETLVEENTHISYLCDLLERIWGHGLKKREVHNICPAQVPMQYLLQTLCIKHIEKAWLLILS